MTDEELYRKIQKISNILFWLVDVHTGEMIVTEHFKNDHCILENPDGNATFRPNEMSVLVVVLNNFILPAFFSIKYSTVYFSETHTLWVMNVK